MVVTFGLLGLLVLTTFAAVASGSLEAGAAAACLLPAMLVSAYLGATRESEIFHPLVFVFATVFFGITVQTWYLLFLDEGMHRFAIGRMTDAASLLTAIAAVSIGLIALLAGFATASRASGRSRATRTPRWSAKRIELVVFLTLGIGLISLLYYIAVFDVMENIREQFAVKRRIIDEDTGVSRTLSWVRFGVNFSQLAFFIAFAAYLRGIGGRFVRNLAIIAGIAGLVMPFIASSRLGILTFLIGAAMIHHFSTGGWPLKRLRIVALVVFAILVGMGSLRYMQTRGITFTDYRDAVSLEEILEPVLGSSNFLAVGKTAAVIEAVPAQLDYHYGSTYFLWMIAPIPRSLWSGKPVIRIGATVGAAVFGTTLRGGIPPGIVGEAYLNFGWVGVPLVMALYGVLLAKFYQAFGRRAYDDPNRLVLYAGVMVFLAFTGLSADFSGMVAMVLQRGLPLLVLLYLVRDPRMHGGPLRGRMARPAFSQRPGQ